MKFVYPNLQVIMRLSLGTLNFLVIERMDVFESTAMILKNALENKTDDIKLYEDESPQKFSKIADVIFTLFDLAYEKREIQKRLFGVLQGISETQDIISEFAEVNAQMLSLLEKLNFESEYDISFVDDFDFGALLKNYSVHMKEPEGRFVERAIEYMVNIKRLLAKNVFIFVNCDAYIPAEDYEYIEECARQYELIILFINNRQIFLPIKTNECIIDVDLCEIH